MISQHTKKIAIKALEDRSKMVRRLKNGREKTERLILESEIQDMREAIKELTDGNTG